MRANTREDELEETVGNVSQTFLGLTINCARCHDHKFDPLYQREYYQLAAALGGLARSTRIVQPIAAKLPEELVSAMRAADKELRLSLGQEGDALLQDARRERAKAARESADMALAAAEEKIPPTKDEAAENAKQKFTDRQRDLYAATDELHAAENPFSIAAWDQVSSRLSPKIQAAAAPWVIKLSLLEQRARLVSGGPIQSFNSAPAQYFHVLGRGSFRAAGQVVSPRGFECVKAPTSDWGLKPDAQEADRRVGLAAWISDPSNPLVARVVVNRLWHHHFGIGIVSTPNDFGYNGDRPSHPELLDWLATQLLRNGWSLKQVHRQIVLSATYRQSAAYNARAAKLDAEDRLLWRKAPLRLTAEDIRDAVLVVSGQLNPRMGGPSYRDMEVNTKEDNAIYRSIDAFNPAVNRRTIYRTIVRAATPPFLETLDCADPNVSTPRRSVTTTPLQALSMLNNPFMVQASNAFASRAQSLVGADVERQIDHIYSLAFARQPTADELIAARSYANEFGLAELCLAIFNSNEFAYVD
jgi:hypothetical protein